MVPVEKKDYKYNISNFTLKEVIFIRFQGEFFTIDILLLTKAITKLRHDLFCTTLIFKIQLQQRFE